MALRKGSSATLEAYVEAGAKRVFASAVEWPGWSRAGRTEADALESLVAHGPRYAEAMRRGGLLVSLPADASSVRVVERLKGGSGTDFGVPGLPARADRAAIDAAELRRLTRVLDGAWAAFDAAARAAVGVELRTGPRGGGRDLEKMLGHVAEAEAAYLHQLGARAPKLAGPPRTRMAPIRKAILEVLAARARGQPLADPNQVKKPWLPRYFVRRMAWHALDHAWEIEDRATPDPAD